MYTICISKAIWNLAWFILFALCVTCIMLDFICLKLLFIGQMESRIASPSNK